MIVKCAWCKKILAWDIKDDDEIVNVSHGICIACAVKELTDQGIDPTNFIKNYKETHRTCKGI